MVKIRDGVIVGAQAPSKDEEEPFVRRGNVRSLSDMPHTGCCPCKPGWVFCLLLLLTIAFGVAMYFTGNRVVVIFFALFVWCVSLCLHEFGHALVAYYGGDYSVRDKGYLSLDPTKYTTLINSVVVPLVMFLLGGIGLPGGAVYINNHALKNRKWQTAVSLAGPLATFCCGVLLAVPFFVMPRDFKDSIINNDDPHTVFWQGMAFCSMIQFSALFLNLIPLPPLDGFGAIHPWLPKEWRDWLARDNNLMYCGYAGLLLVFMLFWRIPLMFSAIVGLTSLFGVPPSVIYAGSALFRLVP